MDQPWQIELLGCLRATRGDQVMIRFPTRKAAALLAYLAYFGQRPHSRELLLDLLWPECDPVTGRHRLAQVLYSLRSQLEPPGVPRGGVIVADHSTIQLNPIACTTDVSLFTADLQEAERATSAEARLRLLARAVERYQGELLPGNYDAWVLPERQRLAEAHLHALRKLVALTEAHDLPQAVQWARRAAAGDPLREETHRELIRLLIAAGQPEAARRELEGLTQRLAQELGAEPEPATVALMTRPRGDSGLPLSLSHWREAEPSRGPKHEPDPTRSARPEGAAAASRGSTAASASPDVPLPSPGGSLPVTLTRFFGREQEIRRLCERLTAADCQLVTLTGPGGIGKTRLAIQVGQQLRELFPGGVWFVPLLDLADPRLLPDQVRSALRLPPTSGVDPLEQAANHLSSCHALLILDNFEHLISKTDGGAGTSTRWPCGTDLLRMLLERAESVTVLATSRQALGLEGEHEFPIGPLPVPDDQWTAHEAVSAGRRDETAGELTALLTFPSVELFINRAQGVRPDFQLTRGNAAAVASLCRGLEGLPLAIELAGARSGVLSPRQMLAHLENRLTLLAGRRRSADPRHRSLRATLDWSYELLTPDLRQLFRRLAVFRGGWTLEASEAVCGISDALDPLDRLRASSLILAEPSGSENSPAEQDTGPTTDSALMGQAPVDGEPEMRCRLLETVRQYAWDRLVESGETDEVHERHRDYYVSLAEQAEPRLYGPEQTEWLDRLEHERENLREALAWCPDQAAGGEAGLRLVGALWRFWGVRGSLNEGLEHCQVALAHPGAAGRTAARAAALNRGGWLAHLLGDNRLARTLIEESLAIRRELVDRGGEAGSLGNLGLAVAAQGDLAAARACHEQALVIHRQLGYRSAEAANLSNLGSVAQGQSDYAQAHSYLDQALMIFREIGNRDGEASALINLGNVAEEQGDYASARSYYEQSLDINREVGNRLWEITSLDNLGGIARMRGDFEAAQSYCEHALAIARETGNRHAEAGPLRNLGLVALERGDVAQARCFLTRASEDAFRSADRRATAAALETLASLAAAELQPRRAARLYGAAAALRERVGLSLSAFGRDECDRHTAAARARLGEEAFDEAWSEGQAMALEQAIDLARAESED